MKDIVGYIKEIKHITIGSNIYHKITICSLDKDGKDYPLFVKVGIKFIEERIISTKSEMVSGKRIFVTANVSEPENGVGCRVQGVTRIPSLK